MANLLEKLFGGLTQEGIALPNGQLESASQAQSSVPDLPQSAVDGGIDSPAPTQSTVQKMPFLKAMQTGPGGTANAMSPALSTKGKILTALLSGAFGALSGAGKRTVGEGFAAGAEAPYQNAQNRQQAQAGQLNNQILQSQVQYAPLLRQLGIMKTQADIGKTTAEAGEATAQTGKANAETNAMPIKTALEQAQTEAAYYKDDPNIGVIDLRTKQPISNAATAPLTAEEAQVLGKQPGERVPLKLKNTANEIAVRGLTTVNTEEGVFERNRQTGSMKRLGSNPRMMFSPDQQYVPVAADPDNPGNVTLMKKGQAASQGVSLPQSAGTVAAKAVAKSEVPTKAGDLKVSFNTAIDHADILRAAAKALNNGDQQTLAGLKNSFKNEFGYSGPITAQAIADAYGNEVTSMLSKGHMTDSEVGKVGKTLDPAKQNFSTINDVLNAYQALAKSKLKNLNKQEQDAVKNSQSGAKLSGAPSGATHAVIVGGKIIGYTADGKTMLPAQ